MVALGSEQEKLAIIEGILEKAVVVCQGLDGTPQSELATEVVNGLRGAMRSRSLSDVYELRPVSASVIENGPDDGTVAMEWMMGNAGASIFVDTAPCSSRAVFLHGRSTEMGDVPSSADVVSLGFENVADIAAKVVDFVVAQTAAFA